MHVLSNFGLKEWEFFSQESSNHRNTIRFLQNSAGKYVLKIIPISRKLFEQIVVFEQNLQQQGVPIPRRYKALTGSYIVSENACNYTLQEYIDHNPWSAEESQIKGLAKVLCHFHDATSGMVVDLPAGNVFANCIKLAASSSEELKQKYSEYITESVMSNWQGVIDWIIKRAQSNYETALTLDYGLYQQPIHGDYHPLNALYETSGAVAGLIDLDQACQDDPLNDFLRGLLHIYPFDFKNSLPFQIDKNLTRQRWGLFVEAYGSSILNRKCSLQMIETITLELIILYHLRGIQKNASIAMVEGWVEQIKSAFDDLKLHMLEASTIY